MRNIDLIFQVIHHLITKYKKSTMFFFREADCVYMFLSWLFKNNNLIIIYLIILSVPKHFKKSILVSEAKFVFCI